MATAMATATATATAMTSVEEEGGATAHQLPTVDDGDPAHQQHKWQWQQQQQPRGKATTTAMTRLEEEGGATAHQLSTVDDGNPAHQQQLQATAATATATAMARATATAAERKGNHSSNDQCCGSGMFLPDPESEFFHPGSGSRIHIKKIPDPGSGCASKILSILTRKIVSKLSEKRSWLFIPDPPGFRDQKGTGSRFRIDNTGYKQWRQRRQW